MSSDLPIRRREITELAGSVSDLEHGLARMGMDAIDEFDRMEALDILNRIERRILAAMPQPATEAAE